MDPGSVFIESYGCTMNHGEARRAEEILASLDIEIITHDTPSGYDRADAVILFTCDVIGSTERRMWKRMEEVSRAGKMLIVGGCLAAISQDEIMRRFPEAVILDSMGLDPLEAGLRSLVKEHIGPMVQRRIGHTLNRIDTIVPISSGCVGNCSYCITRVARGWIASYGPEDIIRRVRAGSEAGRNEILLTSQDTAAYGLDGNGEDLGTLLRSICSSTGPNIRIRVGMMNPNVAGRNIDSIISGFDDPKVFKFFHIPVQSGSNRVLARMKRGYTVEDFSSVLSKIRSKFPGSTISTDLIIGFPDETEDDHEMSIRTLREISPDILNITRFSDRPGTEAEGLEGHIKGWVKKERSREITRVHQEILAGNLKGRLGHHERCLVTEVGKDGTMMARDANYTPIVIEAGREILGTFIDAETSETGPSYLIAGNDWKPL